MAFVNSRRKNRALVSTLILLAGLSGGSSLLGMRPEGPKEFAETAWKAFNTAKSSVSRFVQEKIDVARKLMKDPRGAIFRAVGSAAAMAAGAGPSGPGSAAGDNKRAAAARSAPAAAGDRGSILDKGLDWIDRLKDRASGFVQAGTAARFTGRAIRGAWGTYERTVPWWTKLGVGTFSLYKAQSSWQSAATKRGMLPKNGQKIGASLWLLGFAINAYSFYKKIDNLATKYDVTTAKNRILEDAHEREGRLRQGDAECEERQKELLKTEIAVLSRKIAENEATRRADHRDLADGYTSLHGAVEANRAQIGGVGQQVTGVARTMAEHRTELARLAAGVEAATELHKKALIDQRAARDEDRATATENVGKAKKNLDAVELSLKTLIAELGKKVDTVPQQTAELVARLISRGGLASACPAINPADELNAGDTYVSVPSTTTGAGPSRAGSRSSFAAAAGTVAGIAGAAAAGVALATGGRTSLTGRVLADTCCWY